MKKENNVAESGETEKKVTIRVEGIEAVSPEDAEKVAKILDGLGEDIVGCRVDKGPTVIRLALQMRSGVRYSRIAKMANQILLDLRIHPARIEIPIPGHDAVGIEIPRSDPIEVECSEFIGKAWYGRYQEAVKRAMSLPVVFGKDVGGNFVVEDLATMPHMLVSGAPGQGAPQFLHSVICGLVATRMPEQVQFIIADPRCVEFTPYSKLPHLVVPVINDMRKIVFSLNWAVAEMEKRLKMFAMARVRNIVDFNSRNMESSENDVAVYEYLLDDLPATLPYIVIIISDFDDVMEKVGMEVLPDIQRLAAKARAAGIHLILETERPDKKVLPGTLTANIPVRVAFRSASVKESRMVLDDEGAESLIGQGDALVRGRDGMVRRVQTPSISDDEIVRIVADSVMSSKTRPLGDGHSLSKPQMAEVDMKVRMSFDELKALRRHAEENHCDVDDVVSEIVRERLDILKESFAEDPFK